MKEWFVTVAFFFEFKHTAKQMGIKKENKGNAF